uniref:Chromosome partition protein Smc n=1 Tax=Lygus hesperus TaxID=30085 RepID=A0A0A9WLJ1_LYGHE
MFGNGFDDNLYYLVALLTIQVVSCGVVNVDILMPDIIMNMRDISKQLPGGVLPLNPIRTAWNNSILPFKFDFECVEGVGRAPDLSRRMGNTLEIVSQNQTILHMKLRCGEAQFFYPHCKIDSNTKMFTAFDMQLEGVLQNSDFDIDVNLNHYPICNATLGEVSLVEMTNMSFKFLENKLPKFLSDLISNFIAKYNKKLLDDCVVRAVEESIAQLTEKIDLCEIFHPNLRVNDEL